MVPYDICELYESMKADSTNLIRSDAVFSDCGRYRYWLERIWDLQRPILPWVLLNGSTAGTVRNDPTVKRVIGFTRRWKFGGLWLVNAFAGVATKPVDLFAMDDKVGPLNRHYVQKTIRDAWQHARSLTNTPELHVVLGWGNHGARGEQDRRVLDWISRAGAPVRLQCLGVTKRGCPRHPLYRAADTARVSYGGPGQPAGS